MAIIQLLIGVTFFLGLGETTPLPEPEIINPEPQPEVDPTSDKNDMIFPLRSATSNTRRRWPNGVVPYVIDSTIGSSTRSAIQSAIADFNSKSCIRWVARSSQSDYVQFLSDDGCYSYVGRVSGQQPISLARGCGYKGIAIHEMLHALGFYHEHNRSDRDTYVTVQTQNIRSGALSQFDKISASSEVTGGTAYDFDSVLHYSSTGFSKNGKVTIQAKPAYSSYQSRMGQRRGFSTTDLQELNKLYGCDSPGPVIPTQPPPCVDTDPVYCSYIQSYHCPLFPRLSQYCACKC